MVQISNLEEELLEMNKRKNMLDSLPDDDPIFDTDEYDDLEEAI